MVVRPVATRPGDGHQHLLLLSRGRTSRRRRLSGRRRPVVLVIVRGRSTGLCVRWCSRRPSVVERYVVVWRTTAVMEVAGLVVRPSGVRARIWRLRKVVVGRHLRWWGRRVLETGRRRWRRVVRRQRRRMVRALRLVPITGRCRHRRRSDRHHFGVGRLGGRWCGSAGRRRRRGHQRWSQRLFHV